MATLQKDKAPEMEPDVLAIIEALDDADGPGDPAFLKAVKNTAGKEFQPLTKKIDFDPAQIEKDEPKVKEMQDGFQLQAGKAQVGENPFWIDVQLVGLDQYLISGNSNGVMTREEIKKLRKELKKVMNMEKHQHPEEFPEDKEKKNKKGKKKVQKVVDDIPFDEGYDPDPALPPYIATGPAPMDMVSTYYPQDVEEPYYEENDGYDAPYEPLPTATQSPNTHANALKFVLDTNVPSNTAYLVEGEIAEKKIDLETALQEQILNMLGSNITKVQWEDKNGNVTHEVTASNTISGAGAENNEG